MSGGPGPADRPGKASRFLITEAVELPESSGETLHCASGETLLEAVRHALDAREHVVMVRVSDALRDALDALVEAGICKSRSSAATFMIREGIQANEPLFERVSGTTRKIAELKRELHARIGDVS
jgi:Arc/MetJ-type ribon-helix-helix transcriptional regulator